MSTLECLWAVDLSQITAFHPPCRVVIMQQAR